MGVWIAKAKCGCIIAASVDDQNPSDLARDIGEWILRGDTVEHLFVHSIKVSKCQHTEGA